MRMLINEFKEFNKHRRIFTEAKLSRIWQYIQDDSRSFGIISAYRNERSKEENENKHLLLRKKIRSMNYGYIELKGGYVEIDAKGNHIPVEEESLFIPSIKKDELLKLGIEFNQDSVIYKNKNEFVILSTNEKDGIGTPLLDFIKNGWDKNYTFDSEETKKVFSSLAKGNHRGKKFAYNVKESFLYEVVGYTSLDAYRGKKYEDTDLIKLL